MYKDQVGFEVRKFVGEKQEFDFHMRFATRDLVDEFFLENMGLVKLPPMEGDEPKLVETWI